VLRKDRVFISFRSLYTQRPTQSSVLGRSLGFNAELLKYARISGITGCDHITLAHEGIVECIPGLCAQVVIKSPSKGPGCYISIAGGRFLHFFDLAVYFLLHTLFMIREHVLVVRKDVNV
jgi:hypothetical protein